jgi:hypothetical protein
MFEMVFYYESASGIRISTFPSSAKLVTLYTTTSYQINGDQVFLIIAKTTAVLASWTSIGITEGHLLKQGHNVKSIILSNAKISILVSNLTD